MKNTLGLLLSFFLLSSCAGKTDNSEVNFDFSFTSALSASQVAGGIMLFGQSDLGASFSKNITDTHQDVSLELPKGVWSFHALSWESSNSMTMNGKVRCASVIGADLLDSQVTVDLSFSNLNCDSTEFSPVVNDVSGEKAFPPLLFSTCSQFDPPGTVPTICTATSGNRGFAKSFRISFLQDKQGLEDFDLAGDHLRSSCFNIDTATSDSSNLTDLNIPVGNGQNPFSVEIEGFANAGCDESNGFYKRKYNKGFGGPQINTTFGQRINSNLTSKFESSGPTVLHLRSVFTDQQVCSNFSNQSNPFSTGDGTINSPFGICHPEQFNMVGNNSAYLSSSFILLNDLDFKNLIAGFPGSSSTPECADIANNIIPWGGTHSDFPTCESLVATPNAFSGSLEGNFKTMKNILFMNDELDSIGIIRQLSGQVRNLNIENYEIEAGAYVGTIAGKLNAGGAIDNISLKRGILSSQTNSASSFLGGVVGHSESSTSLARTHLVDMELSARSSYIGGIAGKSNGDIFQSSFDGIVSSYSDDMNLQYVGGISGYNSAIISSTSFNGGLLASAKSVGGLVGYNSGNISDSYSRGAIVSTLYLDDDTSALNLGGLVGDNDAGGITNSYSLGSVIHQCSHPTTTNCKIGDLAGSNSGTVSATYSLGTLGAIFGGTQGDNVGTSAQSLSVSYLGTNFPPISDPSVWQSADGTFPKLVSDTDHPCDLLINHSSVANQVSNNRGSDDKPITLCNSSQAVEINNYADLTYRLLDNIYVGDVLDTNKISLFSGNFLGNNKLLHGLNLSSVGSILSSSGSGRTGFFSRITSTGVVKDIKFVGVAAISQSAAVSELGIVAGRNEGLIENVEVFMGQFAHIGSGPSGIIAGSNMGTIRNVKANFINFPSVTTNKVGGIAGENQGTISKAVSYISANLNSGKEFGAIVGYNSGVISQIRTGANININNSASTDVGAVAGINLSSGIIEDSFVEQMSELRISITGESKIGGLVGNNLGTIRRSIFAGAVQKDSNSPSSNVGTIAGQSSGTINSTYTSSQPSANAKENLTIDYKTNNGTSCTLNLTASPTLSGNVFVSSNRDRFISYDGTVSGNQIIFSNLVEPCNLFEDSSDITITQAFSTGFSPYTAPHELVRHTFYCPSAPNPASFDPDFRCQSVDWDMLSEHDQRGEGNGFNFMIARFRSEFLGDAPPSSTPEPRWIIEEGRTLPEPFFDW